MKTSQDFTPRWACSPGATIRDLMETKQVSAGDLARTLGLDASEFDHLIHGAFPIASGIAQGLSSTIGGSVSFWLRREERFRESEALLEADRWVQTLPLKSMKNLGWLEVPRDWRSRIDTCLDYFGVQDLNAWRGAYYDRLQAVHFRTSETYANQAPAVASWLRAGEIEHQRFTGPKFDAKALSSSVPRIRALTRIADPEVFIARLKELMEPSGVSFVLVPTPDGCAASGASRLLADGSALIQLSGRFLSDDQFWFSAFHEIGHLLLHQDSPLHVDGDPTSFKSDKIEAEANTFAADALWPLDERIGLASGKRPTRRDVVRIASNVGISPGIIVGQLQATGALSFAEFNDLKRRYTRRGSRITLQARKSRRVI